MQGDETERTSLSSLVHKIRRLRRRLLSYGWSRQQSTSFILFQFLKLPTPEWQKPATTVAYYQIKDKYKVEASQAQLIISLQQIVPNLHQEDVLEYLHSVFQYSAIAFGFQLFDSSSDSSENPHLAKRPHKQPRPHRIRNKYRDASPLSRKKVHRKEEEWESKQVEKEEPKREELRMVRKRKLQCPSELQDWEKIIKKQDLD